jgi:hypothetical protein
MAAKGSVAKQKIFKKILEVFPDSFMYNDGKEIRINEIEDGVPVQIKVTLTAAKAPVENETVPNSIPTNEVNINTSEEYPEEPSPEEKERLQLLLNKLGLSS